MKNSRESEPTISRRKILGLSVASGTCALVGSLPSSAREVRDDVVIERRYVDCRYGQLHVHIARPLNPAKQIQNPIMCFHPSPASGWYFRDFHRRHGPRSHRHGSGHAWVWRVGPSTGDARGMMSEISGAMADALESPGYGSDSKLFEG